MAAQFGQAIVFSLRTIWRFGLVECYKTLFFESPEDAINCPFAHEQTFGLTKFPLHFVTVHSSVVYVVKDSYFEKALANLICPVFEKYCIHKRYDKTNCDICQCHIALVFMAGFENEGFENEDFFDADCEEKLATKKHKEN